LRIWGPLPPGVTLIIGLITGFLLTLVPDFSLWGLSLGTTIRDVGVALLTACILGFTIHKWLSEQLVRDAFVAAYGFIFRPEFRQEVLWISSFEWIAVKTVLIVNINTISHGVVEVTSSSEREIENITSSVKEITGSVSAEEWDIPGNTSRIDLLEMTYANKVFTGEPVPSAPNNITYRTDKVSVSPGHKVSVRSKFVEYRRPNDTAYWTWLVPSRNPEVEVKVSTDLDFRVAFGHRGSIETEHFSTRQTLQGTHLPGQHLGIRWWPKG
jgi:hypothetical protein